MTHRPCPGCGASVPESDGPTHRYIGASAGCWEIYGRILARDYGPLGMPPEHRLVVDAYAAQHPGTESPQAIRSVALHLIALHLVLEKGTPLTRATAALRHHAQLHHYTWLQPPQHPGRITVQNLDAESDRQRYATLCRNWAEEVWRSWSEHHPTIRSWAAG